MMLPELTSPPAEWTVSTRLSMVRVSSASSRTLRTVYEQEYGSPTLVGLVQPLVNPIPCWTSGAARVIPGATVSATSIVAANDTANRFLRCIPYPPLESRSPRGQVHLNPVRPIDRTGLPTRCFDVLGRYTASCSFREISEQEPNSPPE